MVVMPEWWEPAEAGGAEAGGPATKDGGGAASGGVLFEGRVQAGTFLGAYARLWLELDGLDDTVIVDIAVRAKQEVEAGRRLRLALPPGAAMVIAEDGASHPG